MKKQSTRHIQLIALMIITILLTVAIRIEAEQPALSATQSTTTTPASSPLEKVWHTPPLDARTRAFWWWLNGNVTKEAITRDLEQMRAKGMGGALIFDADGSSQRGNAKVPAGPMFGTPEWQELFFHAVKEADRLGLELGFSIQSGWNLGGPDLTPEESAKQLCWSEVTISGPSQKPITLPQPMARNGFYRDIAVLAYRNQEQVDVPPQIFSLQADSSQEQHPINDAIDGDHNTFWVASGLKPGEGPSNERPVHVVATFESPTPVSGFTLRGRTNYGPKTCRLFVSQNNDTFTPVTDMIEIKNGETAAVRFNPVEGRFFQLAISDAYDTLQPEMPRNVQVVEFALLDDEGLSLNPKNETAPISQLRLKSMFQELGGSAPDCRPLLFDKPDTPGEEDIRVDDILDLTDRLQADGKLDWQPAEGKWTVLRFGYTTTGAHVSTSSGDWQGPVIDYMSDSAMRVYWGRHIAPMLEQIRPYCGKALKYVETDSWECGGMNWSQGFEQDFLQRRGYDPIVWLPVVAGKIVESRSDSNAFLADFRKSISDCVADNNYAVFAELAAEFDILTQPESGGPHAGPLDGIKNLGHSGLAMSEFWRQSPHRPTPVNRFFVKQASSAAHAYGIKLVGAEGFTSIGPHWNDSLWQDLKPSFDHEACAGLNLTFLHTFTCSPKEMGMPGQEYFAGTHFNPNVTWWPMAGAFIGYMNRCHALLQEGRFVADVCYYYGDHVPNIARLKEDDPAGVLPDYDYDVISEEILLQLEVTNGAGGEKLLALPSGMQYRVLALPDHRVLSLAALRQVDRLVAQGAVIVGPNPDLAVSLVGGAPAKHEFKQLADRAWNYNGNCVIDDMSTVEVLRDRLNVPADFSHDGDDEIQLDWLHRTTPEGDLYFVANQNESPAEFLATFRQQGRLPELWDPMTGTIRDCTAFGQKDGLTEVPLKLSPNGSTFVLFRRAIGQQTNGSSQSNYPILGGSQQINGPWTVSFDPQWGGPESIVFEELVDWAKHPLPRIQFYSGKATYTKTFTIDKLPADPKTHLLLSLGDVREMARIRLNGKDLGIVWAPTYCVDIKDAVRAGENLLEIDVINTWRNRLTGDRDLPAEQRLTRTNIRVTGDWQPIPSGLLGPVTITIAIQQ